MVTLTGHDLSFAEILRVAIDGEAVVLSPEAGTRVQQGEEWVRGVLKSGKTVYGINTGFGIFANQAITPDEVRALNRNLILSHAVGTGTPLPTEVVRAAMLVRANTLASGHSGIRLETLLTLIQMLNEGITPEVPSQGSLGSSGDLAPLSHVALVMTTDTDDRDELSGWASSNGRRMSGKAAMAAANIPRVILEAKESLALTNGATFSAALAVLTLAMASNLLNIAEVTASMTLEAMLGASAAFDSRIHDLRRHEGQKQVARHVRALIEGSTLVNRAGRVQDVYSIRCVPQVHGAARAAIDYATRIIAEEINAVTDNPVLVGPDEALSGGNFHGEPVGMVMDHVKAALSEVAAISERRVYHLLDPKMNEGLPPMLVSSETQAGLNSGLMMAQYTAASLVLESQSLAFPNTVQSLPTSAGKEDHNANAMTAARTAFQIAHNCEHVLAIEAFCASRALSLRLAHYPEAQPGQGTRRAHESILAVIPPHGSDTWWNPQLEAVKALIHEGRLEG